MGGHRADAVLKKVNPHLYREIAIGTVVALVPSIIWALSSRSRRAELVKFKQNLLREDAKDEKAFEEYQVWAAEQALKEAATQEE